MIRDKALLVGLLAKTGDDDDVLCDAPCLPTRDRMKNFALLADQSGGGKLSLSSAGLPYYDVCVVKSSSGPKDCVGRSLICPGATILCENAMSEDLDDDHKGFQIAIIGMACRFPGAKTVSDFWDNIRAGRDTITHFSERELHDRGVPLDVRSHANYVAARGILKDVDAFDTTLFESQRSEAEIIDPQQRVLLECAWETLEDAGYCSDSYKGVIGVYAGCDMSSYMHVNLLSNRRVVERFGLSKIILCNDKDFIANRISYVLNLTGPSITVQSACSTGLTAVHLACQSLMTGECDIAIAGASSIRIPELTGYIYERGGVESPDGRCRAFDATAQGCVFSDGAGMVALKPLPAAQIDGDNIIAVIRGSSCNNCGHVERGFFAPSKAAQIAVIQDALTVSNVAPNTISFIEAHGTGTVIGDDVELAALEAAYGDKSAKRRFCRIASVKTNLGHMGPAAGIGGLIKTALSLRDACLAPSLHYTNNNPAIEHGNSAFRVQTQLEEWPDPSPRRAAVTALGMGGTNVHMILEQPPNEIASQTHRRWHILTFSARSRTAVDRITDSTVESICGAERPDLQDVAYTLHVGRRGFEHRRCLVWQDIPDLTRNLTDDEGALKFNSTNQQKPRRLIFLFGDGDAIALSAIQSLARSEPFFSRELKRLLELVSDPPTLPAEGIEKILCQVAAARTLQHWGVRATAAIGVGRGRLAAGIFAGVLASKQSLTELRSLELAIHPSSDSDRACGKSSVLSAPTIPVATDNHGRWLQPDDWQNLKTWAGAGGSRIERDHILELADHMYTVVIATSPFPERARISNAILAPVSLAHSSDNLPLCQVAAQLWALGFDIDWPRYHDDERLRRTPLPTYPFERVRCWIDAGSDRSTAKSRIAPSDKTVEKPGDRTDIERWLYSTCADILGLEKIDVETGFLSLGGDSLSALQVVSQIRTHLNKDCQISWLVEDLPVREIATRLRELGQLHFVEASDKEVGPAETRRPVAPLPQFYGNHSSIDVSLFHFPTSGPERIEGEYDHLLRCARYADEHDFSALWVPERHFSEFGGSSPNPSVLGSALATQTRRLSIRAGSVVLPLHDPIRIAEEWAVVDQLSNGRVGLSIAAGWNQRDFILCPDKFEQREQRATNGIEEIRRLWRGDAITRSGPNAVEYQVRLHPRPIQESLPLWLTTSGNPRTWERAGEMGMGVLCALLGTNLDVLKNRILRYRQTFKKSDESRSRPFVSVMLHTHVCRSHELAVEQARRPLEHYLDRYIGEAKTGLFENQIRSSPIKSDVNDLVGHQIDRYLNGCSLIGSLDQCIERVRELKALGVDEIACLIDFGIEAKLQFESLALLRDLKNYFR
jgi:natural product biosynthesis luciferase-like monooxygenase protein